MTSQGGNSLLQDGQVFSLQNALIYCNPTEVKMSQMVLPCHANHQGELSMGQLLKWIDTTACLSAEKHAGCSCVTASMDDIHIEHTISVGHVVNIKAKVNRAFNSSMEVGIQVSCENLFQGKEWNVCKAFATFVASKQGTEKIRLKPFEPYTQEEQVEYSIAAERRRMRLAHAETIKALLLKSAVQEECNQSETVNVVPAEKTRVESVELVLPPHANHQGYTFGGQIMAWMENVATIAASRLCNSYATLRTIDMFHFRGPSQVGDRLVLKAIVNSAFKNSVEVGVCAHAYREGSEDSLRHLNSAFMTFIVLDKEGQPITLPQIKPEPGDGVRRYNEANARKKLRLDRKYIISCKQTEVPLSVPWDPCNQVYLSYNNVSALKMLAAKRNWVLDSEKNKVKLSTLEDGQFLSFKIEMEVPLEASTIFLILSDLTRRTEWDSHYQKCEVIQKVNDDDTIYHLITPSVKEGSKFQDFVLLASRRKPCAAGDPFVIAFRSVTLPTHLATSEYTRGEVQCAGFSILQQGDSQTKVTYYNQASPEVLPYITTDIAGLSSGYYTTFESCLKYIERNKNNITLFMQEHKL